MIDYSQSRSIIPKVGGVACTRIRPTTYTRMRAMTPNADARAAPRRPLGALFERGYDLQVVGVLIGPCNLYSSSPLRCAACPCRSPELSLSHTHNLSLSLSLSLSALFLHVSAIKRISPTTPKADARAAPRGPLVALFAFSTNPFLGFHLYGLPSRYDSQQRCFRLPHSCPTGETPAGAPREALSAAKTVYFLRHARVFL